MESMNKLVIALLFIGSIHCTGYRAKKAARERKRLGAPQGQVMEEPEVTFLRANQFPALKKQAKEEACTLRLEGRQWNCVSNPNQDGCGVCVRRVAIELHECGIDLYGNQCRINNPCGACCCECCCCGVAKGYALALDNYPEYAVPCGFATLAAWSLFGNDLLKRLPRRFLETTMRAVPNEKEE